MIRAGELDTRIRIEKPSTAQDDHGQPLAKWSTVAEVWASVARTPGSEVWASAQRNARVPTVFRLRARGDVSPEMRVIHGSRVLDIRSVVAPSARSDEMLLVCEERVGERP